jgi:iron complex transport system ATP-binding protein
MASFLELEHVNVARGDAMVLHDVNLRVEAGEHIAILGPNGCGKSTLIKTMTCELYPVVLEGTRAVGPDGVEEAAGRGVAGAAGQGDA